MKLLTGNSNKKLSEKIAKYLKERLVNSSIRKFKDGEIYIETVSYTHLTLPTKQDV